MRISDWSSDVCSSDLGGDDDGFPGVRLGERGAEAFFGEAEAIVRRDIEIGDPGIERGADGRGRRVVVHRPIDRKSVVLGKGVVVRVDHGCRRLIKKKNERMHMSRYYGFIDTCT